MKKLSSLFVCLALAAACGKKDEGAQKPTDKPTDKPADKPADKAAADRAAAEAALAARGDEPQLAKPLPEPPADDRCEVKVTGDLTADGMAGGGPMAVGTDYWMSEAEIKQAVEAMAGALGGKDKQVDLDAEMKKDPRIYTLLVNCQTPLVKLSFGPSMGSKYADVPFAAKKYVIKKSMGGKPGTIGVLATFEGDRGVWGVDGEGVFDVTKFDKSGIAGTFAFAMVESTFGDKSKTPRKVKVEGKFDFKCSFATSVCKEGLGK